MKKSTRNALILAVSVIAIVVVLGMLTQGFTLFKPGEIRDNVVNKLSKERNPDNLIETVSLESGKDLTSDITFKVDKYGRVTMNGTASQSSSVIYATVTLAPGVYYLTGDDPNSSNRSAYMGIYDSSNSLVARADMGAFTISNSGTYKVIINVFEDAIISNFSLAPVLSTEEDTPFFAEN